MTNHEIPQKPKAMKNQISMLWDAVYNHIPTQLSSQRMQMNFIMGILGLIMALNGALIALVLRAI